MSYITIFQRSQHKFQLLGWTRCRGTCAVHRVERFITFLDFWKPTHFCRSGMFSWAQFQNIGNFGRVHAAKFSFFITGTLKINIFLKMLRNLSYKSKNIRQKLNSKLNFFHINLYFTKMGKTVFNLYREKFFFNFLLFGVL